MSNENPEVLDPVNPALDEIARQAGAEEHEAEADQQAAEAPKAPDPTQAQAWAQIPMMVGGLLAMALPEVAPAYSEDACMRWGGAMAQLADKYGWEAGASMAKYAPEIAVTMASIPLVMPVVHAIRARREAAESEAPTLAEAAQGAEPMKEGGAVVEAATWEVA
jgi:heme exporter protein D